MLSTTTLHDAFLADIIAHPADDTPRLIYADWLEETAETVSCGRCVPGGIPGTLTDGAGGNRCKCPGCRGTGRVPDGNAARAEFIRLQIRIARVEENCLCGGCVRKRGGGQHTNGPCAVDRQREELPGGRSRQAFLRRRERELLESYGISWGPSCIVWGAVQGPRIHAAARPLTPCWAVFRRGFVAEVTCTLADWCGGLCPNGGRDGGTPYHDRHGCTACYGTGFVGGHGPAIVRAQPVERVVLSDRRAHNGSPGDWLWFSGGPLTHVLAVPSAAAIPGEVFRLMRGGRWHGDGGRYVRPDHRIYDTEAAALDALSDGLLAWAEATG